MAWPDPLDGLDAHVAKRIEEAIPDLAMFASYLAKVALKARHEFVVQASKEAVSKHLERPAADI
jgi:hypothetical protein